jgi:hypothetical protein
MRRQHTNVSLECEQHGLWHASRFDYVKPQTNLYDLWIATVFTQKAINDFAHILFPLSPFLVKPVELDLNLRSLVLGVCRFVATCMSALIQHSERKAPKLGNSCRNGL